MSYADFLERKTQLGGNHGFAPLWMPDFLFDFQKHLVEWSLLKGRSAIFADCGLGKTPMQLVWAENVRRKTGRPVLILTPLAVAQQTVQEGAKFGIDVHHSRSGDIKPGINVTNYERLHYLDSKDFAGVVCDESSALKHFSGARQKAVTAFMRKLPYRLLCTATAAPNDYIELGTSSEALGELPHMDMLQMFFKNTDNDGIDRHNMTRFGAAPKWRFKKHAELSFWKWICSWARAIRRPSDLGFDDEAFRLPELSVSEQVISCEKPRNGMLFAAPAIGMEEQREERRLTLPERCEAVANAVNETGRPAVVWCHLNDEGKTLTKLIPDAVEVAGSNTDDEKEEIFSAFSAGQIRVLVTKPKIGAFGLNWQHCAHMTFFPSHSYEQYYQGVRRCWRFGQENPVKVDIITTEGERDVMSNLRRKSDQADAMFSRLVGEMNHSLKIDRTAYQTTKTEVPAWVF